MGVVAANATSGQPTDTKHEAPCPPIYLPTAHVVSNSEVRLGPTNVPAAEPPEVLKVHHKAASLSNAFHLDSYCNEFEWTNSAIILTITSLAMFSCVVPVTSM